LLMLFVGFISPGLVELWEAAVLFALYIVYCIFMSYSSTVEEKLAERDNEHRFRKLDKNRNNQLSSAELVVDEELLQAMKEADTDHDGKLSKQEVKVYLKSRQNMLQATKGNKRSLSVTRKTSH